MRKGPSKPQHSQTRQEAVQEAKDRAESRKRLPASTSQKEIKEGCRSEEWSALKTDRWNTSDIEERLTRVTDTVRNLGGVSHPTATFICIAMKRSGINSSTSYKVADDIPVSTPQGGVEHAGCFVSTIKSTRTHEENPRGGYKEGDQ